MQDFRRGERGSAVVEFALVAPLLVAVVFAVVQLALALHVRSTMIAAAAEGARVAALADSQLVLGEQRARAIIDGNLASSVVTGVHASRVVERGILMAEVRIDARLPLFGLLGPDTMQITGHALQEHA